MAKVAAPTLVIPTGYEPQQRKIASQRRLADIMLEKGLTPQANMSDWTQVLGQLAQTWAGKHLTSKADKSESGLEGQIAAQRAEAVRNFFTKANTPNADLGQLYEEYSANPLLQDVAKPYMEAFAKRTADKENRMMFGGRLMREGDISPNAVDPGKPTDLIRSNPDGSLMTNMPAVNAQRIVGGYGELPVPEGMGGVPGTGVPMAALPPASVVSPPSTGTIEDGHIFLGGNPADPISWRKL